MAILSRSRKRKLETPVYLWDWKKNEIDEEAVSKADYIIHLAGANMANKRWSNRRKQLLHDSRVKSAQLLFKEVKKRSNDLKAYISASAIGYYGTVTTDKIFTETDPPADDFLGKTCHEGEKSADSFKELGIRIVVIRTGIALTRKGGALSKMMAPIKLGLGAAIGTGRQYIP